jgi:hypothetical protein
MSWSNMIKSNIDKVIDKVIDKTEPTPPKKAIKKTYKEKLSNKEIFEMFHGNDLLYDCIKIKFSCEKYTPWLLEKNSSIDLYNFICNFISIENYNEDMFLAPEEDEEDINNIDFNDDIYD